MSMEDSILIGNAFPLALVRRKISVEPAPRETLLSAAQGKRVVSFWGHANTLKIASEMAGVDLTPSSRRPVLTLSSDGLPVLEGTAFSECWLVSPDYKDNFRPAVGQEVDSSMIASWQILRITWSEK